MKTRVDEVSGSRTVSVRNFALTEARWLASCFHMVPAKLQGGAQPACKAWMGKVCLYLNWKE